MRAYSRLLTCPPFVLRYPTRYEAPFFDLAFKIGIDPVTAGLSAALGAAAMGALVMLGIVTGGAAVVVGAIILSIVEGMRSTGLIKKPEPQTTSIFCFEKA
jgi:hypothetical protein